MRYQEYLTQRAAREASTERAVTRGRITQTMLTNAFNRGRISMRSYRALSRLAATASNARTSGS